MDYDAAELYGGFDVSDIDWEEEGRVFASTNLQALHIHGDRSETETVNAMELYRAVSRNRSIKNLYLDGQHFDIRI